MVDVLWVGYPASYTPGRRRRPQYVTLHYTAGSEGPSSAESGVAYDKIRTDGTSAHYYTDSLGSALQELPEGDRAHTAFFHGNEVGIHIEICGTRQTREQWLDGVSQATLRTTAALVADICRRQGFPPRRLSVEQTRAAYYAAEGQRPVGINDHNAITLAYPEDGGTHTDVGPEFPWDVFMDLVAGDGDMMTPQEWLQWKQIPIAGDNVNPGRIVDQWALDLHSGIHGRIQRIEERVDQILALLQQGVPVAAEVNLSDEALNKIEARVDKQLDELAD